MELTVHRKQWPAGHGGFATGSVQYKEQSFEYIYDCGSIKGDVLKKQIIKYGKLCNKVDALFISHVDRDHVNGIDSLMADIKINKIYLPYLTDIETFILGCKLLEGGDLTGHMVDFLLNPACWLKKRGASEVVGIARKKDGYNKLDTLLSPTGELNKRLNEDEKEIKNDLLIFEIIEPATGSTKEVTSNFDSIISTDSLFTLTAGRVVAWVLAPFIPPIGNDSKIKSMINDVKSEFMLDLGLHTDSNIGDIIKIVSNKNHRPALKKIYQKYISDINSASLCLYSGQLPYDSNNSVAWFASFYKNDFHIINGKTECGWIGTGDYDLKSLSTRNYFINHYSSVKKKIVTLMLPHHGSNKNFSREAIEEFNPKLLFVNCPSGSKKHPHSNVLNEINSMQIPLSRVQESNTSSLSETIQIITNTTQKRKL